MLFEHRFYGPARPAFLSERRNFGDNPVDKYVDNFGDKSYPQVIPIDIPRLIHTLFSNLTLNYEHLKSYPLIHTRFEKFQKHDARKLYSVFVDKSVDAPHFRYKKSSSSDRSFSINRVIPIHLLKTCG